MNASYYIFLAGNFISQIGDKIYEIALAWYILEKTGSAISMGGMLVFASLPILLIGPFAGSYIDKVNKKWVMAATDFLRGFLIFYLTWRVYLKNLEVFEVYIAGFILSSLSCFFNPAATASIPFLVEERYIVKATAFNQMARDFSTIAGAATGGAIVGFFGVYMAFLLNASSFMVSGVCILIIKLSTPVVAETVSIIANLKDGFKYVYSQKTIFHI
ncbi:MAG TPA: MFS transporter, partial [Candidatus Wallbacteria bacterium]|nr:MFS transporter [Candidatus Wallbacteria bacterium]